MPYQQDFNTLPPGMPAGAERDQFQISPQDYQQTGERGPSTQTLIDENLVGQVYQAYVKLLAHDKNAKVKEILQKEPFISFLN